MLNMTIRLMLVDDHVLLRMGLVSMLELDPRFKIVAEADNGSQAIDLYEEARPDVTLLDIRMPGLSGVETLQSILSKWPKACVIMLTTSDLEDDIERALTLGARGYLLKKTTRDELIEAIVRVHAGEIHIPQEISKKFHTSQAFKRLSDRERELLTLLPKGLSNPDIARVLGISAFTVKNHLYSIFKKLEVTDRAEAVAIAQKRGILPIDE